VITGAQRVAIAALGDQAQAAVQQSSVNVVGFVLIVAHDDGGTAEIRTKLSREQFLETLASVIVK
jgi:hypothetical protein